MTYMSMSVNSTDSFERKCRKNVDGSTSAWLAISVTVTLSKPRAANKSSAERVSAERVRWTFRLRRPVGCLAADSSTLTHRLLSRAIRIVATDMRERPCGRYQWLVLTCYSRNIRWNHGCRSVSEEVVFQRS